MFARDKKTDNFLVIGGKQIKRKWRIFDVSQVMRSVVCKKKEGQEALHRLPAQKILSQDVTRVTTI
jgi:hypothetical protein